MKPRSPASEAAPASEPGRNLGREPTRELPAAWIQWAYGLVAVLCALIAWGPLLRAGFLGADMEILLRASGRLPATRAALDQLAGAEALDERFLSGLGKERALFNMPAREVMAIVGDERGANVGSLLSGYSLGLSLRLFGARPPGPMGLSPAVWYRLENLLWLALAAIGAERFLRRVMRPWIGAAQARRASATSAFLLFLHPLCLPSVASLSGRSDLMALCLGAFSAAAYLRGRQEHAQGPKWLSYGLALLASLSGQVALILPLAVALAELSSAHRYRPLRRRLTTALNSLLLFGLLVQVNTLVVSLATNHGYYPQVGYSLLRLFEPGGFSRAVLFSLEKLGALLLPANFSTLGLLGLVLAGAVLVLAVSPAFSAARSAPRLWGWIGAWWLAAVATGLLLSLHQRISLDGLAGARQLLPAVAATCAGLGLASTAVQGPQRLAVPLGVALGLAFLSHGNALPWKVGAERLAQFREDLLYFHQTWGSQTKVLVLDAPHDVLGIDPLGPAARDLLHPLYAPRSATSASTAVLVPVFDLSSEGYTVLAAQADFQELVPAETILGVPVGESAGLLGPSGSHLFLERDQVAGFTLPPLPALNLRFVAGGSRFDLGLELDLPKDLVEPRLELRLLDLGSLESESFRPRQLTSGHYLVRGVGRFLLHGSGGRAAIMGGSAPETLDPAPGPELRYALFLFDGDVPVGQAAGTFPVEMLGA